MVVFLLSAEVLAGMGGRFRRYRAVGWRAAERSLFRLEQVATMLLTRLPFMNRICAYRVMKWNRESRYAKTARERWHLGVPYFLDLFFTCRGDIGAYEHEWHMKKYMTTTKV